MAHRPWSLAFPFVAGMVTASALSVSASAQLPDLPEEPMDAPRQTDGPPRGVASERGGSERGSSERDGGDGLSARALLEPFNEAVLSSEIAAQIIEIPVRNGERFEAGDTLVAFDCGTYEAELDAARATLFRASQQLANLQRQANLGAIGGLDVALAQGEAMEAQARVRSAELEIGRCVIAAPYDGIAVEVLVHPYESVPSGQPLIEILDSRRLEVTLIVPSSWLAWLGPGEPFSLEIDETRATYQAEITKLGARIDPVSQTIPVTGELTDPHEGLVAGMSGTARFDAPETAAAE